MRLWLRWCVVLIYPLSNTFDTRPCLSVCMYVCLSAGGRLGAESWYAVLGNVCQDSGGDPSRVQRGGATDLAESSATVEYQVTDNIQSIQSNTRYDLIGL